MVIKFLSASVTHLAVLRIQEHVGIAYSTEELVITYVEFFIIICLADL
jgi:hypothetical protein